MYPSKSSQSIISKSSCIIYKGSERIIKKTNKWISKCQKWLEPSWQKRTCSLREQKKEKKRSSKALQLLSLNWCIQIDSKWCLSLSIYIYIHIELIHLKFWTLLKFEKSITSNGHYIIILYSLIVFLDFNKIQNLRPDLYIDLV